MDDTRTVALLGQDAVDMLKGCTVAVFGVGGVGSFAAEAIARAGAGTLILVDNDVVKPSNCNRQLVALCSTIGQYKTHVMRDRIFDINPQTHVITHEVFYDESTSETILGGQHIDYVVDAIDSIPSKVCLICECKSKGINIVSSMGAGNKLYPERFCVTDIYKTKCDPIAKILRKQLKNCGIKALTVVCSDELPLKSAAEEDGKRVPASISFVPSVCGLLMAGVVVRSCAGVEE